MKNFTKSLIALSIGSLVLLTSCATSDEDEDCCTSAKMEKNLKKNPAYYNSLSRQKYDRVTRDLTMSYYNDERRSAAVEEGGFKHTLGNNNPLFNGENLPQTVRYDLSKRYKDFNEPAGGYKQIPVTAVFRPGKSSSDYSYYELGRWQRLCDGSNGRNMDRLDWRFVRKNKNAFPADLINSCVMPSGEVLTSHGIFIPSEYKYKTITKTVEKDELPSSVYPYIMIDHTPANTPIVIKEPVLATDDDDSFVQEVKPVYDASKQSKTTNRSSKRAKQVRPYAKSSVASNNAENLTGQSDIDWIEKEIY